MRLAWVLGSFLLIVSAVSSRAATLRVPSEYAAISTAIGAASAGDTVLVAPGTYTNCDTGSCAGVVADMFDGLALVSEGGPDVTRLELHPNDTPSSLVVDARFIGVGGALIEGFEITSYVPASRGLVAFDSENVTVRGCRFIDIASDRNSAAGIGQNGGSIEVIDCEFIRCTAVDIGGGMHAIGTFTSKTVVRGCLFEECGPTAMLASGGGDVEVTGSVFRNNFGGVNAGGLSLSQNESAYVSDCWFEGNVSNLGAGGLVVAGPVDGEQAVVEHCTFVRNQTSGSGGGGQARSQLAAQELDVHRELCAHGCGALYVECRVLLERADECVRAEFGRTGD